MGLEIELETADTAPVDEQAAAANAWLAHSSGDLIEANRRWSALREEFPTCFDSYFGGGEVLRSLGRFDEADAVYRAAFGQFPMNAQLLGDFAAVAQARGDLEAAARRWTTLHTLFPDDADGYFRHARACREAGLFAEAEAVLEDTRRLLPDDAAPLIELAYVAVERGAWEEALGRWDAVVTQFHGRIEGYLGAAQALHELGRSRDAETVLQPAVRLFPDSAEIALAHAWTAYNTQDFASSAQRFANVRIRFGQLAQGYTGGSESLAAAGQLADAEALIAEAHTLFPDDFEVATAYARSPEATHDWEEALRRWSGVIERFPDRIAGKVGYAQCCVRARLFDQAEDVLAPTLAEHGENADLDRIWAECAVERRDWAAAEARWRRFVVLHRDRAIGWAGLGDMLRAAGRFADAEALLADALERFPGDRELERQLAVTATTRRDWGVALSRWEALKIRYPHDAAVADGIADALWHARQDLGVIESDPQAGIVPFVIPESLLETNDEERAAALRELLMQFESLGDDCEFGMVQRRFGAEPIGLLRWTSTPVDLLVAALDSDFAGVGEPEHTAITVSDRGEYTAIVSRYRMSTYTFTMETAETPVRFTEQTLKRMQYLRRKLLEDLADGDKVFVYKSDHGLSDDVAHGLFKALRRHGPARLLCVRLETPAQPRGTLTPLEAGLVVGHMDRFSTVDVHYDAWVDLCRRTWALASR